MKFRSGYEERLYNNVVAQGLTVEFEPFKLPYLTKGNYLPDFVTQNGLIIEAKGYFDSRSRAKMVAVKKHNPDLDIRFMFMNSKTKLRKGSKSTYADWCNKHGFQFAEGDTIPLKWFEEKLKKV